MKSTPKETFLATPNDDQLKNIAKAKLFRYWSSCEADEVEPTTTFPMSDLDLVADHGWFCESPELIKDYLRESLTALLEEYKRLDAYVAWSPVRGRTRVYFIYASSEATEGDIRSMVAGAGDRGFRYERVAKNKVTADRYLNEDIDGQMNGMGDKDFVYAVE